MIRCLGIFLLSPGMLFGFTVTKDTLYSPSLTSNPAYTSAQLKPSGNAPKEVIDSIKFSGDARSKIGYLPKVELRINDKIVDCLDSMPCENSMQSKIFTDTLNRVNGLIQFEMMGDCINCPLEAREDCPCKSPLCQNEILYTGQALIFSGRTNLEITLVETSFFCGGSYHNPFDPTALVEGSNRVFKARPPVQYELDGRKVSEAQYRDARGFIRLK